MVEYCGRAEAFLSVLGAGKQGKKGTTKMLTKPSTIGGAASKLLQGGEREKASNRLGKTSSLCTERHEEEIFSRIRRENLDSQPAHYLLLLLVFGGKSFFSVHQHTRATFLCMFKKLSMVAASGSPLRTSTIVRQKMLCNFHGGFS
jgi:hypothetical protein